MQQMFPSEDAAAAYLRGVRWPDGFACRLCGWQGDPYVFVNKPTILRCRKCKRDTSMTAATVMHATRVPLQVWFWAAYLLTTQPSGRSATQFQQELGLSRYETAFQILHKLRAAMVRHDQGRIGGKWPVEVSEVCLGGKTGARNARGQVVVAGAVEIRDTVITDSSRMVYPGELRLQVVSDRNAHALETFVTQNVEPCSHIITDEWIAYDGLGQLGYDHEAAAVDGDPVKTDAALPMSHLVFTSLKAWLLGTHHGVSPKYLQSYLNEFVFRFNRQSRPLTTFHSLLGIGRAGDLAP